MKKHKLPFDILDSIRGVAALYVTLAHCRGVLWMGGTEFTRQFPRSTWSIADYLTVGSSMLTRMAVEFVIVFFVLSGFSIAHSLSSDQSAFPFYKRRFVRIYPAYLGALVWAGAVYGVTYYMFPQWYDGTYTNFAFIRTMEMNGYFDWVQMVKNFFYMPGKGFITPFWSLTFEVMFYLLAPFLLRKPKIFCWTALACYVAGVLLPVDRLGLPLYLHEFIFTYSVYFAIGVALYLYYDWVMGLFAAVGKNVHLVGLFLVLGGMYAANFRFGGETSVNFMISSLFSVLLIIYCIKHQVRNRLFMGIGHFSYTLYITHFATIYLCLALYWKLTGHRESYISSYWVWMVAIGVCILVAWLQYLIIESPTRDILKKLRKQRNGITQ